MSNFSGIEKSFISSHEGWDNPGDMDLQFYNAKLCVDLGDFKSGTVVDCFLFSPDRSLIQIINNDGEILFQSKVSLTLEGN